MRHAWAGAWICTAFRNESSGILSSQLIREAVAATRWKWGTPPELGMVTFVDKAKVRKKRDPGRCYRKAGFKPCGHTKGGLLALQLQPADMPPADTPIGGTESLLDGRVWDEIPRILRDSLNGKIQPLGGKE